MDIKEKISCKVPFGTLTIQKESVQLINTLLANKMLTNGSCVLEFENKFAKLFNKQYATAVSSGTDALAIALLALQDWVPRSSKVIVPALTFVATANAVMQAGFQPKFVDVDRNTLNIDTKKLEQSIDADTRIIIAVHLMGKPADMKNITRISEKYGLYIIEDCAEAHGAKIGNQFVGSWGHFACYSLYAAHIVSSVEGGMITTNFSNLHEQTKILRNHGLKLEGSNWTFEKIGLSSKMNELEAAIGLYNIEHFNEIYSARRKNLGYLIRAFMNSKMQKYFYILNEEDNETIAPHAFSMVMKENCPFEKNDFINFLNYKGIDNRNLFYCIPTQCLSYKKYVDNIYPEAEYCSNNGTHIGIHQDLTQEQLDYIINSVKEFVSLYE